MDSPIPANLTQHIIRHNLSVFEGVGELGENFKDAVSQVASTDNVKHVETIVDGNTGKIIKVLAPEPSEKNVFVSEGHHLAVFVVSSSQSNDILDVFPSKDLQPQAKACLRESMKVFSVFGMNH